jgi:23S rRNA (adenine2503-C2)-methyltransferase
MKQLTHQQTPKNDLQNNTGHSMDFSFSEMEAFMIALGEPSYRAQQLFKWLYQKGIHNLHDMTDFPKRLRQRLEKELCFGLNEPELIQTSTDGTQKFLFRLKDGLAIETVLIPEQDHLTLCVSTQVGCAQGCTLCLTAQGGFKRNLTSSEILNQFLAVRNRLDSDHSLTNLVLMGMGEPLANYEQTLKALRILVAEEGVQFGRRRITLSTVGLVPMIRRLGEDLGVNLAVSLNAADNTIRSRIMPVNERYPIEKLIKVCREFPLSKGRRITFEYVLLNGINDGPDQAEKLAVLLRGIKAKINLIPFNEYPGCSFKSPSQQALKLFQEMLIKNHYTAIIRKSKGRDILAACGQLAGHKTA